MSNDRSFVESLFDFSFTSFITPRLIKVLYAVILIFITIGVIALVISGFSRGAAPGFLFLFIIGPLYAVLLVISARIYLELVIAVFRIVDLLSEIAEQGRKAA